MSMDGETQLLAQRKRAWPIRIHGLTDSGTARLKSQ